MRGLAVIIMGFAAAFCLKAQTTYEINIDKPEKQILRGHLDLGGKNPAGEEISVNSYFIEKDSKPFFPVLGEFHYSRYPQEYWEESIRKMKAGGINVIATYVFWNIHERQEGKFDWSGDLNLRKFIELVKKNDLYTIVRMGPFCHGEMRNGGVPDWLYGRTFEVRSNDPEYLAYADRLYGQIAEQMKGLLYKDGGPVIGIQLENEYQHSAAPWEFGYAGAEAGSRKEWVAADRETSLVHEQIAVTDGKNPWSEYGKKHMAALKQLAQKHGIDVPLYTATGWGNATIVDKGSLPVTAGYAYPFWADPAPSPFYLFKDIHEKPDYSPVSYDPKLYPSVPAEIGPGIQVKWSRRPPVPYESVTPLMVRIIGSGSNGIGYYMYHGGTTPSFDGKFYNEQANGIPRMNYDFQAPIGQYGQVRAHFKSLRMLHHFLQSYGEVLAPMKTVLPETNAGIAPKDIETLRYAVRSYGDSGFLFMINFQDHLESKSIDDVSIKIAAGNETVSFPVKGTFSLPAGSSAIFPFNLKLEKTAVKSATVQPLTRLDRPGAKYYVFSSLDGIEPEIIFSDGVKIAALNNAATATIGSLRKVSGKADEPFSFDADGVHILVIPQQMAFNAAVIKDDLYITDALLLDAHKSIQLVSRKTNNTLHVFPARKEPVAASAADVKKTAAVFDGFSSYEISFEQVRPDITIEKATNRKYVLKLNADISNLNDVFVEVDYVGDRGLAFIDGKLITDHLFYGGKWQIGLRKFAPVLKNDQMVFVFHPMYSDYPYLEDLNSRPAFDGKGSLLQINGFEIVPEYKATLTF
ncbi:MAG: beta-galactosidase [Planctomycetaceae bacterium]|nr:beta-galactosidase [Planctomycetaceae bacterium]